MYKPVARMSVMTRTGSKKTSRRHDCGRFCRADMRAPAQARMVSPKEKAGGLAMLRPVGRRDRKKWTVSESMGISTGAMFVGKQRKKENERNPTLRIENLEKKRSGRREMSEC